MPRSSSTSKSFLKQFLWWKDWMGNVQVGGISADTDRGYTERATTIRSPNGHLLQVVKGGTVSRMRWTKIGTFQMLDELDLRDWVRSWDTLRLLGAELMLLGIWSRCLWYIHQCEDPGEDQGPTAGITYPSWSSSALGTPGGASEEEAWTRPVNLAMDGGNL